MKRSPEFGSGEGCVLQEAGAAQARWLFPNLQRVGEHFFQSSCCVYIHGFLCRSDPCRGCGLHQVSPVRSPPNIALLCGILGVCVAGPVTCQASLLPAERCTGLVLSQKPKGRFAGLVSVRGNPPEKVIY